MPCDLEFSKDTIKMAFKNKSPFKYLSSSTISNTAKGNNNSSKNLEAEEIIQYIFQVHEGLSYENQHLHWDLHGGVETSQS